MKKAFALLLALALALSLCACGDSGKTNTETTPQSQSTETEPVTTEAPEETPAPVEENGVVGVYKLTAMKSDDEEGNEIDMMALMELFGIRMFLVLNEDGTGCLDSAGEQSELRWEDSHLIVTGDDGTEERPEFTFVDGVISFEEEGTFMEFTKLNAEELADYEENGSGMPEWASGEDEIPEGDPSTEPVTATIEGCEVTVLGAQALQDDDGSDLLRVYYTFTNSTGDFTSASYSLYFAAYQDGERCSWGYTYDNAVPEDQNASLAILPGKTILCTQYFLFDPAGGTICVHLSDLWDSENLYYYIDPANPIGAPTEPFVFETDPTVPDSLKALPSENDALQILRHEPAVGYNDETLLRVYTQFTNLGEEATSFFMEHTVYAFQDGYELETGYAYDDVEEDDNFYTDIDPEAQIDVARCFELRSESPVIFVIESDATGERIGLYIEDLDATVGEAYVISSVSGISMEQYAALTNVSLEEARRMMVITLFPDGSAIFSSNGDAYEVRWAQQGEDFSLLVEGETILTGKLVGDTITIVSEGAEILLTKN